MKKDDVDGMEVELEEKCLLFITHPKTLDFAISAQALDIKAIERIPAQPYPVLTSQH